MKKESNWSKILNYIADKEINDLVTRQDLLKLSTTRESTIDTYRMLFTKIGVLESVKRGIYKKTRNIRNDISLSLIREMVYEDNWKSWFIQIE